MKKTIVFFTALLLTGGFSIIAQDLDEVLANHFEVIGQDKILEYQTFVAKGKIVQMGMEFPMTLIQKRPGMMRMEAEIQGAKLVQAYDGKTGWAIMPWTGSLEPQDMGEQETKGLKQMADIDGELYDWEKKGFQLTLIGEEDMEGTPVFKLKLVKEDGDEFLYYIDAENYVVLRTDAKVEVNGAKVESSSFYSNFKPVSGVILPFSIESRMNDQVTAQIAIDSYEMDSQVDDSLFTKPVIDQE